MKKILYFLFILFTSSVFADNVRQTKSGIIIVGSGDSVRAFEPFRGTLDGGQGYADAVNKYKQTFGDAVNVYCMIKSKIGRVSCRERV